MTEHVNKLIENLHNLVGLIPKSKRLTCQADISALQAHFKDETDLTKLDRRGSHWKNYKAAPQLIVDVRGQGSYEATFEEVAKMMRKSVSLVKTKVYASESKRFHWANSDGDVYTITKK